jgi:hypothetical protein
MNVAAVSWLNIRIILKSSYTGFVLKYGVMVNCGYLNTMSSKSCISAKWLRYVNFCSYRLIACVA